MYIYARFFAEKNFKTYILPLILTSNFLSTSLSNSNWAITFSTSSAFSASSDNFFNSEI